MVAALLLAAGSGQRLGYEKPKAFVELAGKRVIDWSLELFSACDRIQQIVVALPPQQSDAIAGVSCVTGGATRSESVQNALAVLDQGVTTVLVHDAARPLLSATVLNQLLERFISSDSDCLIAAAPVFDTIKRVDQQGRVTETLDRNQLRAIQTPQIFKRSALKSALQVDPAQIRTATDDASLLEQAGFKVEVFCHEQPNFKVTTALDLKLAESLLQPHPLS